MKDISKQSTQTNTKQRVWTLAKQQIIEHWNNKITAYNYLGYIEALAQTPNVKYSTNPSSKIMFPADSRQQNLWYQSLQLGGNSEEHSHND
jgi:hypothetical protein